MKKENFNDINEYVNYLQGRLWNPYRYLLFISIGIALGIFLGQYL